MTALLGELAGKLLAALAAGEGRPEIPGDRSTAEGRIPTPRTDRHHDVGIHQRPRQVERPALLVGRQVGRLPGDRRIEVDRPHRSNAAAWRILPAARHQGQGRGERRRPKHEHVVRRDARGQELIDHCGHHGGLPDSPRTTRSPGTTCAPSGGPSPGAVTAAFTTPPAASPLAPSGPRQSATSESADTSRTSGSSAPYVRVMQFKGGGRFAEMVGTPAGDGGDARGCRAVVPRGPGRPGEWGTVPV